MALIYRENAKEKLREGERYDVAVRRLSSFWWIAVLGSVLILLGFGAWAFKGEIPLTSKGTGIYLQDENEILCFVPLDDSDGISANMKAVYRMENGEKISGTAYVGLEDNQWDTWNNVPEYVMDNEGLIKFLTNDQATVIYRCSPEEKTDLTDGAVLQMEIYKGTIHPVELWL